MWSEWLELTTRNSVALWDQSTSLVQRRWQRWPALWHSLVSWRGTSTTLGWRFLLELFGFPGYLRSNEASRSLTSLVLWRRIQVLSRPSQSGPSQGSPCPSSSGRRSAGGRQAMGREGGEVWETTWWAGSFHECDSASHPVFTEIDLITDVGQQQLNCVTHIE